MHENESHQDARAVAPLYGLEITLPDDLNRRFAHWTTTAPGASWPAQGGHITLAPRFAATCNLVELEARLAAVCSDVLPFELRLGLPTLVDDVTRPHYKGVFLVPAADDAGIAEIYHLRAVFDQALEPVRLSVSTELDRQPFLPHVTLALGVSEAEGGKLVQSLRGAGLVAELLVDTVWLTVFRENGEAPEHRPLMLGRAAPGDRLAHP